VARRTELRARKRAVAERLEREVEMRVGTVEKGLEGVEKVMGGMRRGGEEVLRGSLGAGGAR
jgi:hypothetical protein